MPKIKMENPEEVKTQETKKVDKTPKKEVNFDAVPKNDNFWKINLSELPSRGIFYPENTIITGRPLKVLEVKQLSTLNEDNTNYIINNIISRAISGINIGDILVADKLYLLFWLRANTFSETNYKIPFHCDKCQSESTYHFDIDDLSIEQLPEDFNADKILELSNGKQITFRFQTIADELALDKFNEQAKSDKLMMGNVNQEILNIATMINTINEEKISLKGKYNMLISDLDIKDYARIESEVNKLSIGIKPVISVECDKCQGVAQAGLQFRGDFFIPEYYD